MAIKTYERFGRRYISGIANVRVQDKSVSIFFKDELGSFVLDRALFPKAVTSGEWCVRLNKDGKVLYSIWPASGRHKVALVKFAAGAGGVPVPWRDQRTIHTASGSFPIDEMMFTVVVKIVSGKLADLEFSIVIPARFQRDTDGNLCLVGKGKRTQLCSSFLLGAGMDFASDTIPYHGNPLPDIEMLLLSRRRVFEISLDRGYVQEVLPTNDIKPAKSMSELQEDNTDSAPFDV